MQQDNTAAEYCSGFHAAEAASSVFARARSTFVGSWEGARRDGWYSNAQGID